MRAGSLLAEAGTRLLGLPICEVIAAAPETRIMRVALNGYEFPYRAGQAAVLGAHGQPLRRPYAIASAPGESRRQGYLEFLVKVDRSAGGRHLPPLRPGSLLDVEGPFGSLSFPDRPVRRVLFVAGGTGIAPLRAMIHHAIHTRYQATLALIYSARTPSELVYGPQLQRLAKAGRLELHLHASRDAATGWTGNHGRITGPDLRKLVEPDNTLCVICGPPSLVREASAYLLAIGVEASHILKDDS